MRALALGLSGGALAMALLTPWTLSALAGLSDARKGQAELAGMANALPSSAIVSAGLSIPAATRSAAVGALAARVRAAAGKGGVLVEGMEEAAAEEALVRLRIRLSGTEGAVLGLVDALERGSPLVRFVSWRVEARSGSILLTGELVAPWG